MSSSIHDPTIGKNEVKTVFGAEDESGYGSPGRSDNSAIGHGAPELIETEGRTTVEEIEESKKGWFAYLKTRDFYIVLVLGYVYHLLLVVLKLLVEVLISIPINIFFQYWSSHFEVLAHQRKPLANKPERQILALCITSTNTFSSLLVNEGTSIPAFQTWFNYVLLNAIYTSYTIYRYGFKGWCNLILKDGWKCENPPFFSRPDIPYVNAAVRLHSLIP